MTITVTMPFVPSSLPPRPLAETVVVEAVRGKADPGDNVVAVAVVVVGDRDAQLHRLLLRVPAQAGKNDNVEPGERERYYR